MVRVSSGKTTKRRHKKVLKQARGAFLGRSKLYRRAVEGLRRSLVYAYRDRRVLKRDMRKLWILRITAACKEYGVSYSRFISGLAKENVALNRKIISEIAIVDPKAFDELVNISKTKKKG